ncbi:Exodeoxyribonuclease I subunit D [Georgenia satyanarayanai]|uniref:Nuclease SbcCD subunit D n=1 Tax=Georgenia satyanarayanai TaxID=860221 RepID=A0A2Y9ALF5_9MICO|nr:exonuclease SbcCD subunit D [Georgenia satyanarayanai]PYF99345.1 exodeoxyribonuclease I subunit D [Georgenia satyanarayanai]SSA43157.1 Exodeoxyribonuclease I subunit D [Georgenia satyanarayanai]
MRILHTSDWHLGRTLHGVDLVEHQAAFLDHLVEVVRQERVDAVLVAGDVYDRAIPPVAVVDLLTQALLRLTELTRVVLTPGNHDSATRLGFAAPLFRERLAVRARVEDLARPLELPAADGESSALVYALPYLDPDTTRHRLAEDDDGAPVVPARSHEAVAAAAMRRVRVDLAARRAAGARVPAVVMAHAFVVGGRASESERDIRVGGVDAVPLDVLTGGDLAPDYLALGHLHGPQRVGPERADGAGGPLARYSGSPLAYSFSERHHTKSSVLLELAADGVGNVELVPTPRPRRLSEASGSLDELLSPAFDSQAQDWVRVAVTDTARPRDLYARVRARFPHALVVQHRPAVPLTGGPVRAVTTARDPLEVAAEFVHEVTGEAPTTAETAVLRAAYEAALAAERSA